MSALTNEKDEEDYIFFGFDTLNRVSFLRENNEFIKLAIESPSTKFIIFNKDSPYAEKHSDTLKIHYSNYSQLKPFIDDWLTANNSKILAQNGIVITFLGINERINDKFTFKKYSGIPYFGIDITQNDELIQHFNDLYSHLTNRNDIFKLDNFDASIFSHSKMYLDWLKRNKFCAGCGSTNIAIHSGTKLQCGNTGSCPVKDAPVSNISFPRTDSVIITGITNSSFDKILLGRGRRFPKPMYSCIAGFVEPSESIEVASVREVWEETGVRAKSSQIVKSQPWPYPANLMIGCIAIVDFNGIDEVIDLGHDPELLDAKWFDVEEIKQKLNNEGDDASWLLPPSTAIAHHLINYVVKKHETLNK